MDKADIQTHLGLTSLKCILFYHTVFPLLFVISKHSFSPQGAHSLVGKVSHMLCGKCWSRAEPCTLQKQVKTGTDLEQNEGRFPLNAEDTENVLILCG